MLVCQPDRFRSHDVARYLEKLHGFVLEEPPLALRSGPDAAVWRLTTRGGDYIAKIFAAPQSPAVSAELDLLDYLADAAGIRTPQVLKNRHGQRTGLIRARLPAFWKGGCPIVITVLEDGRRAGAQTVSRQELRLVGRCIGLMHEALQTYPRRARVRRMERCSARLGRFDDLLGSFNVLSFDSGELARWSDLDRRMEEALGAAVHRAPVTESVLHGDLGLEHIRFLRTDACSPADVYFFDFSDFSCGPVVFDLAVMLSRLYWESDISLARWEQLRAWLLEGYESDFMLSGDDRGALDEALLERLLIEVRYLNRMSLNTRAPYRPDGVRKRYELAAYVLERAAEPVTGGISSAVS